MIGDYTTKPLQGALLRKFRDQIIGVTPAQYPGPGKTHSGVGKKGKVIRLVPPWKEAAPQECVGSRTQDRAKLGPGRVKKIADLTIFNQSTGKSGSYCMLPWRASEWRITQKVDPCFISLLKNNLVENSSF
jgi:hypothetical protein